MKTKAFVVTHDVLYEFTHIMGVYSSKEKAEEYINRFIESEGHDVSKSLRSRNNLENGDIIYFLYRPGEKQSDESLMIHQFAIDEDEFSRHIINQD
jgi:hypothetical protein